MTDIKAKDLTKVAPRSAKELLGGYAILARAIDKGRATIAGTNGEYNFDCPVDNKFLSFTGIKGPDMKAFIAEGHTDEEVLVWVSANSIPKTDEEIKAWSLAFNSDYSYSTNEWFIGECKKYNLDPLKTTLFDFLDVDDKSSFKGGETCPV